MEIYDKLYFEIYALLAINAVFQDSANSLQKSEHPDWIDSNHNLGLEVVRAMTPHMGYVWNIWNEYHGKDIRTVPLKKRKGFLGEFITSKGKLTGISDSKALVDGNRHIYLAIDAVQSKLRLLNSSHFQVFENNELFVYVVFTISESDLALFVELYLTIESDFQLRFSTIYLFDNAFLYRFRTNETSIETFEFPNERNRLNKENAQSLRERANWENKDEFYLQFARVINS